jgi:DNA (cytosine-5)-methyltransferase 1
MRRGDSEGSGARQTVAALSASGVGVSGPDDNQGQAGRLIAGTVTAKWAKGTGGPTGDEVQNLIVFDARQITSAHNRTRVYPGAPAPTLNQKGDVHIAYQCQGSNVGEMGALRSGNGGVTGGVPFITHPLTAEGHDASEDGTGRGTPLIAFNWYASPSQALEPSASVPPLKTSMQPAILEWLRVRRLTPLECTRLMGFPDYWLDIPTLSDSAKYRMLGNSVVVPVIQWIGRRTALFERPQSGAQ